MTDDYNEKNGTADNIQREINMLEKGKQRFERRNAKKSLDQTKVGIDIISLNVGGVEEALKDLLRYRKAGAGGPKAKWEMHLYRLDANWDTQSVDATGKPIFNEIDDMNLFLAADLACRVSMECYHKGMTIDETCDEGRSRISDPTLGKIVTRDKCWEIFGKFIEVHNTPRFD